MTVDEGTLRRLKKLLALATDPRTPTAEAEAAMSMAQKTMAKYGVTEGHIASAEVGEAYVKGTSHVRPSAWEGRLAAMVGESFGCKVLWCTSGYKGAMNRARWQFIGLKHNVELVTYSFEVLQRQVLKARAGYVATQPEWYTRPEKAARADTFCEAFVAQLWHKVSALTLEPAQQKAIEQRFKEQSSGERVDNRQGNGSLAAAMAGAEAGEHAYLNRPMPGQEARALLEKR